MNTTWPPNRPIWSACDETRHAAGLGPALIGICPTACPLHTTCPCIKRLLHRKRNRQLRNVTTLVTGRLPGDGD